MGNALCGKNIYRLNRTREESHNTVELEKLPRPGEVPARDVVLAVPRIIVTDDEKSYVIFDPRTSVATEDEKRSIMLLGVKISKPKRFFRQKAVLTKHSNDPVLTASTTRASPEVARAAFTQSSIILNKMRPGSSPASSGRPSRLRAHSLLNIPSKSRNIPYRPSYGEPDSQNLCLKPMDTLQVPVVKYAPPIIKAEVHQRSSQPKKSPDSGDAGPISDSKKAASESETGASQRDQSKSEQNEAGPNGGVATVPQSTPTGGDVEVAQPGRSTERQEESVPKEQETDTARAESGSTSDADGSKK